MADSESGTGITRQGKGIFVGVLFIAWGVIGALWSYYGDTDSLDIIRMMDASENAIVHAVIWTGLGVGFVLWYMIGPGSSGGNAFDDNEDGGNEFK
jgi:hypothetical protein